MSTLSPEAHQTLHTLPALRGLGEADREQMAALFEERQIVKGTAVFREGDPGSGLYILVTGEVEVQVAGRIVAHLGPGEWFGEMALITGAPRSATVQASLDCRLLVLEAEAFSRLLAIHPALYQQLAGILSQRLARTSRGEVARHRFEIVLVENRGHWREPSALVEGLAASLKQELDRPVAVVTVARGSAAPRPGRPDVVLSGPAAAPDELRERVATRLASLSDEVSVALVVQEDPSGALGSLASLADTVVLLAPSSSSPEPASPGQRTIAVYDRRLGPVPPLSGAGCVVLPRAGSRRRDAIARLARAILRRTVGLALGSGFAYGLAHIGVLETLEQEGVPIDFVAGTSMGAIIGAGYALGLPAAELHRTALRFTSPPRLLQLVPSLLGIARDLNLIAPGILAGDRLFGLFGRAGGRTFADLHIPFRAVATDLETAARVEIGDGKLSDALRASCSVPWMFSPHRLGDRLLIDGGIVDPVPSETVRSMGADMVIAVNVVPPLDTRARNPLATAAGLLDWLNPLSYLEARRSLPNSFDVVMRSLLVMQHELGNARAGEADVLIRPPLNEFWFLEFWSAPRLIEKGAEATRAALATIRDRLHGPTAPVGPDRAEGAGALAQERA